MSVQTLLLDFSIDPARLGDESGQKTVFEQLETVLKDYIPNLILAADINVDGGSLKLLTGKKGMTVSVRMFDRGLVTVNIEYFKEENEEPQINYKCSKLLESSVRLSLECERVKLLPTIKRGYKFDVYLTSSELERNSKKCEKEEKMEKEKAKKAIQKGNMEGARIHAENAIRQKNQALNYLRMSARVDAVSSRVQTALTTRKSARELASLLKKYTSSVQAQAYPPLNRCLFGKYFPTSDERLLEYDIDSVLFDEQSSFQRVQIVHSKTLGNMLVLDDLQNISEADLIYTETLMQRGKENYEGKEIVILGGGDGALLYELLKEKPKFVWMLEIDELVMSACNKHLKSICGDVLEQRKGKHYEIIVEDCMLTVNKFIKDDKKVDYIFGDLTDIPISESPCGELWEFMITILQSAFKILKPSGKFMTHGNGATSEASLEMYEQELTKLKPPVKFTKSKAFVPSFLEDWIFYQIGFKATDNGDA